MAVVCLCTVTHNHCNATAKCLFPRWHAWLRQAGDWPLAEALHEQQAALLRTAGMKAKLATHLYTFSTLRYVR